MTNVIQHVIVDGKDELIVINGFIIKTTDSGNLNDDVERLEEAIDCKVIIENVDNRLDGDWTYDDVLQFLPLYKTYLNQTEITTIDDWFELNKDSKAFLVNEAACSDYSFPSIDDVFDSIFSFYIYGKNGINIEIDIDSDDIDSFKIKNERELVLTTKMGKTYSFQALY